MFNRNSASRASWNSPPSETKAQLSRDIFNLRRSLRGKERKKWAKIEADVVRHKCPVAEGLLEGLSHYRDDVNEIAASIEKLAASSAAHHPKREATRSPSRSPAIEKLAASSAAHHSKREATRSPSRSPVVNGNINRSPNRSGYNSEPRQQQESLTRYIARKSIVKKSSSPCSQTEQNGTPQVNVHTENRLHPQLVSESLIPHPSTSNIVLAKSESSPCSSTNNSSERLKSKKQRSLSPSKKSKKQQHQEEENHIEIDLVHGCVVVTDGCQGNSFQGNDDLDKEKKLIYKVHEESLMKESWFQPDMSREDVEDVLHTQKVGSFLVRRSTTCTGYYALAVRVPKRKTGKAEVSCSSKNVAHFLVAQTVDGQTRLKGSSQQWPSLKAMIEFFCKDSHELLPCTLRLPSKGLVRKLSDCPVDKKKTKKQK